MFLKTSVFNVLLTVDKVIKDAQAQGFNHSGQLSVELSSKDEKSGDSLKINLTVHLPVGQFQPLHEKLTIAKKPDNVAPIKPAN